LYNGVVFLNQVYLVGGHDGVAESLMATYLGLFQRAVAGGELKSRLLAALLAGVARAQPYLQPVAWKKTPPLPAAAAASKAGGKAGGKDGSSGADATAPASAAVAAPGAAISSGGVLGEHIDTIFKIVHTGSFQSSTQALSILLFFVTQQQQQAARGVGKGRGQGGNGGKGGKGHGKGSPASGGAAAASSEAEGPAGSALVDRFYRALYAALGAGHFAATAKPTLFLNLIFKVQ
jgi:hypothetical protein